MQAFPLKRAHIFNFEAYYFAQFCSFSCFRHEFMPCHFPFIWTRWKARWKEDSEASFTSNAELDVNVFLPRVWNVRVHWNSCSKALRPHDRNSIPSQLPPHCIDKVQVEGNISAMSVTESPTRPTEPTDLTREQAKNIAWVWQKVRLYSSSSLFVSSLKKTEESNGEENRKRDR
jgi:hypothetical protein